MEPKHRARHRASATKGTTALRHHQDGKGSSSQPTGYAVHVTPYLCAEKFIKSLTTDVRLGGGFFVCAQAARGPFPNAGSACTCCWSRPSSSTSPRRSVDISTLALLLRDVRHPRRLDALRWARETNATAININSRHLKHRRLPRQGGAWTSKPSLFCFEMYGIPVD